MSRSIDSAWTTGAIASKNASAVLAGQRMDRLGEGRGGQRPRRDDDVAPLRRRQPGDLLALDADVRVAVNRRRHRLGEPDAVDRQRAARRQLVPVRHPHDQRAAAPHLLVQQADGVELASSERKLLEQTSSANPSVWCASVVRDRPHLVEDDRGAGLGRLPGGLGAGEPGADDVDGFVHMRGGIATGPGRCNTGGQRGRHERYQGVRPPESANVQKVIWALEEIELPYEHENRRRPLRRPERSCLSRDEPQRAGADAARRRSSSSGRAMRSCAISRPQYADGLLFSERRRATARSSISGPTGPRPASSRPGSASSGASTAPSRSAGSRRRSRNAATKRRAASRSSTSG